MPNDPSLANSATTTYKTIRRCVSCATPIPTQGNGFYFVLCAAAAGFVVVCVLVFIFVSECCCKGRKGDGGEAKGMLGSFWVLGGLLMCGYR